MEKTGKRYDVFISHASEDKDSFVRPLADILEQSGLTVWYDEFSLRPGDSLSASIDKGIQESRYGLLVLSPHFLCKNWTDYEYRSLLSRQIDGERIIIPLWYGVGKEDVKKYSLFLADIMGIAARPGVSRPVVMDLLRVIRPDIWREMRMRDTIRKLIDEGQTRIMKLSDIVRPTEKRSRLTPSQLVRSKAIYYGIGQHLGGSLQEQVDSYELDIIPERELQTWEIMNACYLEMIHAHPEASETDRNRFYKVLLFLSIGDTDCHFGLPESLLKELFALWLENNHND